MSVSNVGDAETTPSQVFVSSAPRLPIEGQTPLPQASFDSPSPVGQVHISSAVPESSSFEYFSYEDLLRVGSYKRQFHSLKPKTSGYMLYASTMQTTIEQRARKDGKSFSRK